MSTIMCQKLYCDSAVPSVVSALLNKIHEKFHEEYDKRIESENKIKEIVKENERLQKLLKICDENVVADKVTDNMKSLQNSVFSRCFNTQLSSEPHKVLVPETVCTEMDAAVQSSPANIFSDVETFCDYLWKPINGSSVIDNTIAEQDIFNVTPEKIHSDITTTNQSQKRSPVLQGNFIRKLNLRKSQNVNLYKSDNKVLEVPRKSPDIKTEDRKTLLPISVNTIQHTDVEGGSGSILYYKSPVKILIDSNCLDNSSSPSVVQNTTKYFFDQANNHCQNLNKNELFNFISTEIDTSPGKMKQGCKTLKKDVRKYKVFEKHDKLKKLKQTKLTDKGCLFRPVIQKAPTYLNVTSTSLRQSATKQSDETYFDENMSPTQINSTLLQPNFIPNSTKEKFLELNSESVFKETFGTKSTNPTIKVEVQDGSIKTGTEEISAGDNSSNKPGCSTDKVVSPHKRKSVVEDSDDLLNELASPDLPQPVKKKLRAENRDCAVAEYLYARGAVKKKSERQKLQGWDCVDCRQYYEGLGLTASQMKGKMDLCSRHRDNYNPNLNITPIGFWNPEFPPTPEQNKTQVQGELL